MRDFVICIGELSRIARLCLAIGSLFMGDVVGKLTEECNKNRSGYAI